MMDSTTVLLFVMVLVLLSGAILLARRWDHGICRVAGAVGRVVVALDPEAEARGIATVRAELAYLLDVGVRDVTAWRVRLDHPGQGPVLRGVSVVIRAEPVEALVDTLIDLEESVWAQLPEGVEFTIEVRPAAARSSRSIRPTARAA